MVQLHWASRHMAFIRCLIHNRNISISNYLMPVIFGSQISMLYKNFYRRELGQIYRINMEIRRFMFMRLPGMVVAWGKVTDMAKLFDQCNRRDSEIEVPNLCYYINQAKKLHKKRANVSFSCLKTSMVG